MIFKRSPNSMPRITCVRTRDRFLRLTCTVGVHVPKGTWLWVGGRNRWDYGVFKYQGICHLAHRISYAIFRGPIPEGMTIQHAYTPPGHEAPLPNDVNPDNLELAEWGENVAERNVRRSLAGNYQGIVKMQAKAIKKCTHLYSGEFVCPDCHGTIVLNGSYNCLNCDFYLPKGSKDARRLLTQDNRD